MVSLLDTAATTGDFALKMALRHSTIKLCPLKTLMALLWYRHRQHRRLFRAQVEVIMKCLGIRLTIKRKQLAALQRFASRFTTCFSMEYVLLIFLIFCVMLHFLLCLSSFPVLCVQCWQCLWIVHSQLPFDFL